MGWRAASGGGSKTGGAGLLLGEVDHKRGLIEAPLRRITGPCSSRLIKHASVRHTATIVKLLVRRLPQAWPEVRIMLRGDSGFHLQRSADCCEPAGAHNLVGVARNARPQACPS